MKKETYKSKCETVENSVKIFELSVIIYNKINILENFRQHINYLLLF